MTFSTLRAIVAIAPLCLAPSFAWAAAPTKTAPATKAAAPEDEEQPKAEVEAKPEARKEGAEALAIGTPTGNDEAAIEAGKLSVHPFFMVAGGAKMDFPKARSGQERNSRFSTYALGRLGVRARYSDWMFLESEIMASGGVSLHGTSAFEGQAALQVRQQLIRLSQWGFRLEVGRLIDEASVDFFSAHVTESFIQDTPTRDPLLFSGFNLGNGIRAAYEVFPGLRVAMTVNAANPVATTASLMVGGAYPPFDRFYTQPYQQVNQSANHFPDDTFHAMFFTPSILLDTKIIDARVAAQLFDINVNTTSKDDDHIRGYNLRGTVRAKLFNGHVVPFLSPAYTKNDTLLPADLSKRAPERYVAINAGGGVDIDIRRRFRCSHDCADGFGLQYQQVQFQIGDGLVTTNRYVNIGGSYWLAPNLSANVRYAQWTSEAEEQPTAEGVAAGQTQANIVTIGERSIIAGLRFVMP